MMKRLCTLLAAVCAAACATQTGTSAAPIARIAAPALPKLVVLVVIDGLPMEQLYKNYDLLSADGFRRFMDHGAWFADAHQAHAFTLTAPGHAAISTGAYPYQHGIIGNEWRDRSGKYVYNTADATHKYLDGTETTQDDGVSPKLLKTSAFGDELAYATNYASRVYTVSGKDRGAILLAGKTGKAFMYSTKTGRFTSTSYYMEKHPGWWDAFYAGKPQDQFFQKAWTPLLGADAYARSIPDNQSWSSPAKGIDRTMGTRYGAASAAPDGNYYRSLLIGPFADDMMADFTIAMMRGEQLGKNARGAPDVIGVSFSGHDYVNHAFGPESIQSQDHLLRLDRTFARFFAAIDAYVGRDDVAFVLTADHGFANAPETNHAHGHDADRLDASKLRNAVNAIAEKRYGIAKIATQHMTGGWTLDYAAMDDKKLDRTEVEAFIARALVEQPGIAFAFTRTQFERGQIPNTRVGKLAQRAWHQPMAVDIMIIPKPWHAFASRPSDGSNPTAATHGTPYGYDTHVPLMFYGPRWINAGRYPDYAEVVDIAPTIAALLRTRFSAGKDGYVLSGLLREQR